MPDISDRYHLVLRHGGVGDAVALSPLVRDLVAVTGRPVSLSGVHEDLFRYDPRVCTTQDPQATVVRINYKQTIQRSGGLLDTKNPVTPDRTARYLNAAHEAFRAETGIDLCQSDLRPSLVLGDHEQDRPYTEPYWVLATGTKPDMPVKNFPDTVIAKIVARSGLRWKQVGALYDGRFTHRQRWVPGTENLLGRTTLRDLMRLIAYADGVLCLCSLPMMLAAAFGTPCVALGGGREDAWLHAGLPNVEYLHTMGELDCCKTRGCRRRIAVPGQADVPIPPAWLCDDPVQVGDQAVGRCMTLITPARIDEAMHRVTRTRFTLPAA